jgi:hypothetical protein
LHPSQVFARRKAAREERPLGYGSFEGAFTPVLVSGGRIWFAARSASVGCGRMEIVLLSGRPIVVDGSVDAAVLDQ